MKLWGIGKIVKALGFWSSPKGIDQVKAEVREAIGKTVVYLDKTGEAIDDINETIDIIQKWANERVDELQKDVAEMNRTREEAEQFLRDLEKALGDE